MTVRAPTQGLVRRALRAARHCGRPSALCLALTAGVGGCFGTVNDPVRHYYTLHLEPLHRVPARHVPGLLRVRDLDAEAAYDRFQMVMRRSPFELSYRQKQVWAVKPQRMISDLIARGLVDQGLFSGVTRELGERRPNYLLSGELHAIEIYESQDAWFAHLAMSWQITDFEAGKTLWTFNYDDRKQVTPGDFAHAVRAVSELLTRAIEQGLTSMQSTRFAESLPLERGTTLDKPVLIEEGMAVPRGAPASMPPPGEMNSVSPATPLAPPGANGNRDAEARPHELPEQREASPLQSRGAEGEVDVP